MGLGPGLQPGGPCQSTHCLMPLERRGGGRAARGVAVDQERQRAEGQAQQRGPAVGEERAERASHCANCGLGGRDATRRG